MKLRIKENLTSNEFEDFYTAAMELKQRNRDIYVRRNGNIINASGFDFMAQNLFSLAREYLSTWDREIDDPSRYRKQTSYGGSITHTYKKDGYTVIIKMI